MFNKPVRRGPAAMPDRSATMSRPDPARPAATLESAFAGVADNYRGTDVDLHAVYREM